MLPESNTGPYRVNFKSLVDSKQLKLQAALSV
jgi:hypothetical protein